jgi:anionic cell wall polymer biosynthesis LytR-Cps2A-Psr (LCP) family protein
MITDGQFDRGELTKHFITSVVPRMIANGQITELKRAFGSLKWMRQFAVEFARYSALFTLLEVEANCRKDGIEVTNITTTLRRQSAIFSVKPR